MTDTHDKTELVPVGPSDIQRAPDEMHPLVRAAVDGGSVDTEMLAKLMDLQERHEANEARKAYTMAMARLKERLPKVVDHDSTVDFPSKDTRKARTHYTYASAAAIVSAVVDHMAAEGLSHRWESTQDERGNIVVICVITHISGHTQSGQQLRAPPDTSGNKSAAQSVLSTRTTLQRATLMDALGITSGDSKTDEDGHAKRAANGAAPVNLERNRRAVAEITRRGHSLDDAHAQVDGRTHEQWTADDRETLRDWLQREAFDSTHTEDTANQAPGDGE